MVHVTQVLNAKIREAPKVEIVQQGKLNFFIIKGLTLFTMSQCADEKSNESVEDMDRTFAGW